MKLIFFFLIAFILFFILTRNATVRIKNDDGIRIEIHLPIFAIIIDPERRQKNGKQNNGNQKAVIAAVRGLIKRGTIKIDKRDVKKIIMLCGVSHNFSFVKWLKPICI
jgi:hypothetical protein